MGFVVACIVGYVLGSVPVSLLAARRHGVDLYRTGDGNPGGWNAVEELGWCRAWPAFIGVFSFPLLQLATSPCGTSPRPAG